MPKISVPAFEPDKPTTWAAKPDTVLTREELVAALRYAKWQESVRHAVDGYMHDVLMNDVYGTGLRALQKSESE